MAPQVLLAPEELALALSRQMALHSADVVFLASNAKPDEVAALRAALQREVLLRSTPDARRADAAAAAAAAQQELLLVTYDAAAQPAGASAAACAGGACTDEEASAPHGAPELAVLDTLICAHADAFLGTRRSMFSWNILEERVLAGHDPKTGSLMG